MPSPTDNMSSTEIIQTRGCGWLLRGELLVRVEDRGPGIPEEHLPHIFERFYRVDRARTRRQEGAGLGLSIAKTIVQAHGGRIEAESHIGEGTRMSLHLPLAAEPERIGRTVNLGARDGRPREQDHE